MVDSTEIQNRQNSERYLKVQFAARHYYNCAEAFNRVAWWMVIIGGVFVFVPQNWPKLLVLGVPALTTILGAFFTWEVGHKVNIAARLRSYFDAFVLDFQSIVFTEDEARKLIAISEKLVGRDPYRAQEQMQNTGRDNPPGVKNWYEFSNHMDGVDAQFECQKQNKWWTTEMCQKNAKKIAVYSVLLVFLFVTLVCFFDPITVLLCSAGLFLKCAERIYSNIRYAIACFKIKGTVESIEVSHSEENIDKLQNQITELRGIPVMGSNHTQKKYAKAFSELYEKIVW